MTDEQFYTHNWLSRMWDRDQEIRNLKERAEDILGAKIATYEVKEPTGSSDTNPTEAHNIEYALLMSEIQKKEDELAVENNRTYAVLANVKDRMLRGILYSRYVLRKSWSEIGKDYNYSESRIFDYRNMALDAIAPFIPKGELIDEN